MAEVQAAVTVTAGMPERAAPVAASLPASASAAGVRTVEASTGGTSFSEILAELNPLQHIPLVGTLYRAVTGEQLSEPARLAGSLVFGGLTGGPIGVATSLASTLLQKLTGIDADALGQQILASIGIGHAADDPAGTEAVAALPRPGNPAAAAPEPAAPPEPAGPLPATSTSASATPAPGIPAVQPWSATQLAALGVTTTGNTLRRGTLEGADALNSLELDRQRSIDTAIAAYGRQGAVPAA